MKRVLYGFGVAVLLVLIAWQWQKNNSTKVENVTITGPQPAEKVAYVTFDDGPSEITPGILDTLKKLSEERMLLFDEALMTFTMGNCIVMEDTNGNRKLLKKRYEAKIDAVAAMMDAFVAYKINREAFE